MVIRSRLITLGDIIDKTMCNSWFEFMLDVVPYWKGYTVKYLDSSSFRNFQYVCYQVSRCDCRLATLNVKHTLVEVHGDDFRQWCWSSLLAVLREDENVPEGKIEKSNKWKRFNIIDEKETIVKLWAQMRNSQQMIDENRHGHYLMEHSRALQDPSTFILQCLFRLMKLCWNIIMCNVTFVVLFAFNFF